MNFLRALWRDENGTAFIETALVAPILVTLGFGVFEFANVFRIHQTVTTGVHDAARYLARTSDPNNSTNQLRAKTLAVNGSIDGSTPRVPGWTVGTVTVSIAAIANPVIPATGAPAYRGGDPLYVVTVGTNFSYGQIGFLTGLGLAPPSIVLAHSERAIGG